MPKLSIILPVYNVEKYLPDCLTSILNQTYDDFELIIIDDGSTDQSLSICKAYELKDTRIRVYSQCNAGLSAARNKGIDCSQGTYLAFVDSDDTIDSEMYETMMSALEESEVDIVVCGHRVVSENGEIIEEVKYEYSKMDRHAAMCSILDDDLMPSFAWNRIYARSLFDTIRFPEGRIYEDIATIYKLYNCSDNVLVLSDVFYNYLRRNGSICLRKGEEYSYKRSLDLYLAFSERYQFVVRHEEYQDMMNTCANVVVRIGFGLLHLIVRKKTPEVSMSYNTLRVSLIDASKHCLDRISLLHRCELLVMRCCPKLYKIFMYQLLALKHIYK